MLGPLLGTGVREENEAEKKSLPIRTYILVGKDRK